MDLLFECFFPINNSGSFEKTSFTEKMYNLIDQIVKTPKPFINIYKKQINKQLKLLNKQLKETVFKINYSKSILSKNEPDFVFYFIKDDERIPASNYIDILNNKVFSLTKNINNLKLKKNNLYDSLINNLLELKNTL